MEVRDRRRSGWLPVLTWAAVLLAVPALWVAGFVFFLTRIPSEPDQEREPFHPNAIVVLPSGDEPLQEGLRLLADLRSGRLFIPGVSPDTDMQTLLATATQRGTLPVTPEQVECCIFLGHAAGNSLDSAVETAEWLRALKVKDPAILLVTSRYNMPGSLLEFRWVMPGLYLSAYPVSTAEQSGRHWWLRWQNLRPLVSEYGEYLQTVARILFSERPIHWFSVG